MTKKLLLLILLVSSVGSQTFAGPLTTEELKSLREEVSQVNSVDRFLRVAEKLTTRAINEDNLVYVLRDATGPMGAIKQRTFAALSVMDIPPEVRGENSRVYV